MTPKHRYGVGVAGNLTGTPYDSRYCAREVVSYTGMRLQCGYPATGLYCERHKKETQ